MKKISVIVFLLQFIFQVQVLGQVLSHKICINQEGYIINYPKIATILSTQDSIFYIVHAGTREKLYKGKLKQKGYYFESKDSLQIADFSDFNKKGEYFLLVPSVGRSYNFQITSIQLLRDLYKVTLKSFYYQRASMKLEREYAGIYEREMGHPDTFLYNIDVPGIKDSSIVVSAPGGWYDAGDYGKYVVNGGVTVATMLQLYELVKIDDDSLLNIPESGNGIPDLLDEVRYELEWFLKMQDKDGGVFFKVAGLQWPGMIAPKDDKMQRFVIGKSTTSTLNFAGSMALASRVYAPFDSVFAKKAINAAIKAWEWAIKHPRVDAPSNTMGSGPYSDQDYNDEFFWAATELYLTTNKEEFKKFMLDRINAFNLDYEVWWQDLSNLSYYSLFNNLNKLDDKLKKDIISKLKMISDNFLEAMKINDFKIPMFGEDYHWGSNGALFNKLIIPIMYYSYSKDSVLLDNIIIALDYALGRNALCKSMITGVGDNRVMQPHHRPSASDEIMEPVPGLVTGGPNANLSGADKLLTKLIFKGTPPAKCYIDEQESYSSNEPAINQNAPAVFVYGALWELLQ